MSDALDPFFLDDPAKLEDPFADLAWLREHRPVYRHAPLGEWFVFRYDDVRELFADPRMSAERVKGLLQAVPEQVRDEVGALLPFFGSWLIMSDGERHSRLRRLIHLGFNVHAIEALREPTERIANELIDRRLGDGVLDLSSDFGLLLPVYVLSEFVGAPPEDRERFVQWSLRFVEFFNEIPITEGSATRMVATTTEMTEYFRRLMAERRREPVQDFLSTLLASTDPGDSETEEQIIANTMLLLLAGHLPVRNLIGNAIWLLLTHPEQESAVRSDFDLLAPAIEETLRYEPPVSMVPRIAREELEIRGQSIPAGAIVQLSIVAANRDPSRFPDPEVFSVTRRPHGILSFGHGPHGCLGAHLAHEQALIALRVLFERLGEMRLGEEDEIRWYRNAGNRGPDRLPVKFQATDA
jgi:cytochrome P450